MRARRTILFRLSGLVLAAIIIMGLVSIAVTFYSPPPFRPPVRTSDILAALDDPHAAGGPIIRDVRIARAPALPPARTDEYCDNSTAAALAQRLGLAADDVRLCTAEPLHQSSTTATVPRELRDHFSLAVRRDGVWQIARLPPQPIITRWHVTTFGWLLLAGLILFSACLFIVRSITRPLRQLAADARTAGIDGPAFRADPGAPAEVLQLGAAIAGMRRRQASLVTNRAELLVGIAHDLGTPLTRLAFRVEALPDASREAAQADIAEMQKLIAAALEFARGRERSIEPVALDMLLADRAQVLDRDAAPIRILHVEPSVVVANMVDLMRVIDNLIINAQRHGGSAELSLRRLGDTAVLTVRDHGPGIDPSAVSRVFDPLYRGNNENADQHIGVGIGLGLAIVQSTVESLGGSIAVANHAAGGALFSVKLPIVA